MEDPYPNSSQTPATLKLSFSRDHLAHDVWHKRYGFLSKLLFKPWTVNHWEKMQGREGSGGKGKKGVHIHTHKGARRHYLWWIHKTLLSEIKSPNSPSPFSSVFHLCIVCHILFSHLVAVVYIWWILQNFQLCMLLWFLSSFTVKFLKAFLKSSCLGDTFPLCRCKAGITAALCAACPVLNPVFIAFRLQ